MTEMEDAVRAYVAARSEEKDDFSPGTAARYRGYLLAFSATYGDRPIKKFRHTHVTKFLQTRGHLASSTRRAQFSCMRQFCEWLVLNGMVDKNPLSKRRKWVPSQPQRQPRALEETPVADLFSLGVPDRRGRAIVALMVGCGLRCVEVSRLMVEDWNRGTNIILVTGKRSNERYLPVPPMVQRHLEAYLMKYPGPTGFPMLGQVHDRSRPLAPQTISKYVAQWMTAAGVKRMPRDGISAHALRHTAATDVLAQVERNPHLKVNALQVVQAMLGHQSLATTEAYLSLEEARRHLGPAMSGRDYTYGSANDDNPDTEDDED